MKIFPCLLFALVALVGTNVGGQTPNINSGLAAVELSIVDQADSPLKLTIDEKNRGRFPGTPPLMMRNDSSSLIVGAVIRFEAEKSGSNTVAIFGSKGLKTGGSQFLPPRISTLGGKEPSKQVASVDYVLFSDGQSWGADSLGRSVQVEAYIEGINLAVNRLNEFAAGQDISRIRQGLESIGMSSFGHANSVKTTDSSRTEFRAKGYRSIVMFLRSIGDSEREQDLARKLELAAPK
ncbi:MAG: hypothetical protein QM785_06125 [Pyrinomonadaceae bacterium]